MIVAGLLLFIRALAIGFFCLVLSTFLAIKSPGWIGKLVDHPWISTYFDVAEKCVAKATQQYQRHAGWLRKRWQSARMWFENF